MRPTLTTSARLEHGGVIPTPSRPLPSSSASCFSFAALLDTAVTGKPAQIYKSTPPYQALTRPLTHSWVSPVDDLQMNGCCYPVSPFRFFHVTRGCLTGRASSLLSSMSAFVYPCHPPLATIPDGGWLSLKGELLDASVDCHNRRRGGLDAETMLSNSLEWMPMCEGLLTLRTAKVDGRKLRTRGSVS